MAVTPQTNRFRADAMNSAYLAGKSRYGEGSFLFFDAQSSTDPLDNSSCRGLFVDSSNRLSYWNGTTTTRLSGSGAGTPTWEDIYAADATFALTAATWTITQSAAADLLTLTKSNLGAGAVLAINNSGSGNDVTGTSGLWSVSAAGLATFATGSIVTGTLKLGTGAADGTLASNGNFDLILQTGNATTNSITIRDGNNVDIDVAMQGTGKFEIAGTTEGSTGFQLTNGDAVISDGSLTLTDDDNAASFVVTNNTATTIGAAASSGVVNLVSTSLTTGALLNLELTEGTLNGGWYLRAWDATAGGAVFSVGEDGLTTIAGVGGSNVFVVTAGDVLLSDASLTLVDADNAASFSLTNNTATTASVVVVAGSGTFTGNTTSSFMTVTPSGLTTGTGVYLPLAGLTQGKGLHITAGASQTTGSLLFVQDTGANSALTSGTIATFDHTATAITGTVNKTGSGVAVSSARTVTTGTVADDFDLVSIIRAATINGAGSFSKAGSILYIENQTTNTSGTITDTAHGIEILMDADGTGDGVNITHPAITGKAINVSSSGTTAAGVILATANALTSGQILKLASSATAIATTGRLFLSSHTGATGTSATLNEFITSANDETIVLKVTAASLTTGTALALTGLDALTDGIGVSVSSAATALTSTGRLAKFVHSGATTTSGILVEVSSAANDETVLFKATASDVLATGVCVQVSAASMTTGKAFAATDLNALTTGIGLHLASSATAITGAGRMVFVNHTGATGGSAILNEFKSAANDETVVFQVTGTDALAAGKLVNLSAAAATTGTILDITDNTAHTTGYAVKILTNSADTGTRSLLYVKQDHASASGATPLELLNDGALALIKGTAAAVSTNYFRFATINGVTIWVGNGTTANGALAATTGDILINGGSNKPEYCSNGGGSVWAALV